MLQPWHWWLTLVGVSVLLGAVLELVPPLLVKQMVDAHLALGRSEGLLWIAALYLGATAAVQAMGFLTEYLTAIIAQGVLRRLRVRLFGHLQTLPLSYYDRTPLGDTISRCTADVETVSTLFTTAAAGGAVASSGGGQAGTSGATVLMGVVRLGTIAAAMVALSPLLSLVAALVLWVGVAGQGWLASLAISLGTLTAFVLLLQRFFVPIMSLGNEWQTVQAALAGLERIIQVLVLPSAAPVSGGQRQPHSRSTAAIEMREVVFGHLPNHPVLRGVSLVAQPGEHLVLV